MAKPSAFYIDSNKSSMYYNSKELFNYDASFYYGCKTKPRMIITKKMIPETEYRFANKKASEWNLSNAACKKAQLLISKKWVDQYFFKVAEGPVIVPPIVTIEQKIVTQDDEVKVISDLPDILQLEDNEKFKDSNGKIIEIETRGERKEDHIYFKCKDVSIAFGILNLNDSVINKRGKYTRNIDYKTFNHKNRLVNNQSDNNKTVLYLTYSGLLRVLFVSRNTNAEAFRKWATHKLFTIQMGNSEEKMQLSADIADMPGKTFRAFMNKYMNKIPSIYLMSLGTVGMLRDTFGIDKNMPDDSIVYKYGFTDDMWRRTGELMTKYNKLKNVILDPTMFCIIDPKYTSDAEGDIRSECNAYEVNLPSNEYKELIVLNKKQFEHVKKNYARIGRDYTGHTLELQNQITELKNEIRELNHENEKLRTLVVTNKTLYDVELKNRDLQIEIYKLQQKQSK